MAEFNVLKEFARMVKPDEYGNCTIDCEDCPIYAINNVEGRICYNFIRLHPEIVTEIIRKWSEEHPQKTRGDLIREHFPNANLEKILPCEIMGSKWKSENCEHFKDCRECQKTIWNEVAE